MATNILSVRKFVSFHLLVYTEIICVPKRMYAHPMMLLFSAFNFDRISPPTDWRDQCFEWISCLLSLFINFFIQLSPFEIPLVCPRTVDVAANRAGR